VIRAPADAVSRYARPRESKNRAKTRSIEAEAGWSSRLDRVLEESPSKTKRTKFGKPTMSKLTYSACARRAAWERRLTSCRDPRRSSPSAPHHTKRSLFEGLRFFSCAAISRITAEPLPLSLMPGPRWTLSRLSAITLRVCRGRPPDWSRARSFARRPWPRDRPRRRARCLRRSHSRSRERNRASCRRASTLASRL